MSVMILELKNVFKNYYRGKTEIPVLKNAKKGVLI